MRKQIFMAAGLLLLSFGMSARNSAKEKSFRINTGESRIEWVGKKIAGQHSGTLNLKEGIIGVLVNKITAINVSMDMNSIACTDLNDANWNQKLVGHLKSDDFFGTEKYPESQFVATGIHVDKSASTYTVTGVLTIKGISNEITFPAKIAVNKDKITATGTAVVDRTKYGIKYGSGSFFSNLGDKAIQDNFEITFNLVATPEL